MALETARDVRRRFEDFREQRVALLSCAVVFAASGLASMYTEEFWAPLAAVAFWAFVYTFLAAGFKRWPHLAFGAAKPDIEGYARWSYKLSIVHQAVVLPVLVVIGVIAGCSVFSWQGLLTPAAGLCAYTRHTFYATSGAMVKDFWIYRKPVELWMTMHHIATMYGCSLCLSLEHGAGLAALNAFLGELSSASHNIRVLRPSRGTKALNIAAIGAVNLFVMGTMVFFVYSANSTTQRVLLVGLASVLFVIRTGGLYLMLMVN